ncbi:MAG: hypothetical protein ACYDHB_12390, partial [Candidatus Dormibacteria bacterium]
SVPEGVRGGPGQALIGAGARPAVAAATGVLAPIPRRRVHLRGIRVPLRRIEARNPGHEGPPLLITIDPVSRANDHCARCADRVAVEKSSMLHRRPPPERPVSRAAAQRRIDDQPCVLSSGHSSR